jgi:hypothetical protein
MPEFRPNPNLPKPMRRKNPGPNKALVLLGGLMMLALLGLAITAPLRRESSAPKLTVDMAKLTKNPSLHRRQFVDVSNYKEKLMAALSQSNISIASVRAAIGSGNHQAVVSALGRDISDKTWTELSALQAPLGLAEAKENIVSGLFMRKIAVQGALTGSVSSQDTMRKINEADGRITKGLSAVDQRLNGLRSDLPTRKTSRTK